MPQIQLNPTQRREHRANAHHLEPVVLIGGDGLTAAVKKEVDAALNAHGLIKVRIFSDDRAAREQMYQTLTEELSAAPVQHIGSILVVWRARREDEKTAAPAEKKPARASTAKSAAAFAAAARRAALAKASAESRRSPARAPAPRGRGAARGR